MFKLTLILVFVFSLWAPLLIAQSSSVFGSKQTNWPHLLKARSLGADKSTTPAAVQDKSNPLQDQINYETKWYTQTVDHFSWANGDTFEQRYLVNKDHWCGKNCPILFYCGNEGDIEVFTNNTGWMWQNAESLHAMLIFAEHRYYGKSIPYGLDPTLVTPKYIKQLGFLNSEQALADYAKLIYSIKNELYEAKLSPVIAVGGSYGGMLAAWMRMKYPNAVAGALAGSAPILQFPGEYECSQFNRIVTKDYENYSPNCSMSIATSWQVMRDFVGLNKTANSTTNSIESLRQKKDHLDKLSRVFNTCTPMNVDDVGSLIELLNSIWVNMAMTDYANEATFLSKMPAFPIKHACANLDRDPINLEPIDLLNSISKASQIYTNYTGQLACLNISSFLFDPMDVMWDFQSCTEMVMPICSDGVNDMFDPQPFNLTTFVDSCKKRWGVRTQVDNIRTIYGDRSLLGATNIIFSSCSRDPWSAGCPQDSVENDSIHAIKIEGACHHEDLRASGPGDSDAVKQARQKELDIISRWIEKHYEYYGKKNESVLINVSKE